MATSPDPHRPIRTPDLERFPDVAQRIDMTVSCTDTDELARVPDAGDCKTVDGTEVQVMHNGIVVARDSYCGPWMTEIIRCLRGFHEPQEELVFANIIDRLSATDASPSMIELGSWWSYYGLWFRRVLPGSRVVAVDPDPAYLAVSRQNFALNDETADFVHGGIAPGTAPTFEFLAPSDYLVHNVPRYTLGDLLEMHHLESVSLVLADIQGAETALVEGAAQLLADGAVRFMVISTHHHSISGDALTHQRTLEVLTSAGAHVIAEHSVGESFSGDGLIAVSFDPRDRDLTVDISRARCRDSLFGEPENELFVALARVENAEAAVGVVTHWNRELEQRNAELESALAKPNRRRLGRLAKGSPRGRSG